MEKDNIINLPTNLSKYLETLPANNGIQKIDITLESGKILKSIKVKGFVEANLESTDLKEDKIHSIKYVQDN